MCLSKKGNCTAETRFRISPSLKPLIRYIDAACFVCFDGAGKSSAVCNLLMESDGLTLFYEFFLEISPVQELKGFAIVSAGKLQV